MRVRILSGNLAGTVQDLPRHEAEAALATGFAEVAPEPPAPPAAPAAQASPTAEPAADPTPDGDPTPPAGAADAPPPEA